MYHCMKRVRIWSYSGPHFPPFGLNTERCGVSFRIQSECGKIRIRMTPNTDTFQRVYLMNAGLICRKVTNVVTERLIGNSMFAVSSDLSNHIFKGRMSLTFELIYGKSFINDFQKITSSDVQIEYDDQGLIEKLLISWSCSDS